MKRQLKKRHSVIYIRIHMCLTYKNRSARIKALNFRAFFYCYAFVRNYFYYL